MATSAASVFDSPPAVGQVDGLRVALAHDWLVRYGGAERCLDELLNLFPESSLHVAIMDADAVPKRYRHATTSVLQGIPGASSHHQLLLPLMPLAWRVAEPLRDVDVVISSSYACAKAVRVAEGIPHVCYCHTPMRYAWQFRAEKGRVPVQFRPPAAALMGAMRRWDRRSAGRVSEFIANSTAVATRIRNAYGRRATVIHPPVRTDFFTPAGEREDFFLYVGRLVAYKRADAVVRAFAAMPESRLVLVGTGPLEDSIRREAPSNVEFRPNVSDNELRDLYRRTRALVFPAEEDFGIAMAEAQACGTPVIGLAAGGALDIVRDRETGWLITDASPDSLCRAIRIATAERLDESRIRSSALRFSPDIFRQGIADAVSRVVA